MLHSVYGHVAPTVRAGATLVAGATLGKVGAPPAAAAGKRAPPPHLHLSAAWLDPNIVPPESWAELQDGRALFGCPSAVPAAALLARGDDEERAAAAARASPHGAFLAHLLPQPAVARGSPVRMLRAKGGT